MKIELIEKEGTFIAEVISDALLINDAQDALDILGNCGYQGAEGIIMLEGQFSPDFFDLKTGMAGEVLQKFSTYNMRLAIVGEYAKFTSSSLRDFIYESNKTGRISFVNSADEAKTVLFNTLRQ